jgi:ABC-type transport system involved in cytochrome c biogenesis permease subunit
MSGLETFLAYLSGLAFLADDLTLAKLVPTMIIINICDAIMCRLFAHNNGYPKNLWTAIGLVFGLWGVMLLIVMPKREKRLAAGTAP